MHKLFEHKTIIVTGASHGLGKHLAQTLSAQGAQLILIARDQTKLNDLQQELEKAGGLASSYACDLRDPEIIRSTIATICQAHTVDIVINNAGLFYSDEQAVEKPELRQVLLETNALGHIELCEALLPHFQAQNRGYFFNIISKSAASDTPGSQNGKSRAYGASKWALRGYTNALITALKDSPIKVTGFYPASFDSGGQAPDLLKVEDLVQLILFALTQPSDLAIETLIIGKKP